MLKSKSLFLSFMLLLVMSIVLVACGDNGDEPNAANPPADDATSPSDETAGDIPEKPEVLSMWVNDEEAQIDAYEEITARFTEEYGIEVNITPFSMVDQTESLSLDGPQGLGPDLFFQPHDRMGGIHIEGLAAELELTEDQLARLSEYSEEAVNSFSYEGIQYGIPAVVETYGLFYNTDLVPEAPETLEELMTIARELTEGDQYGFLMEATNFYFTYPFLTGTGGYVFAQDETGAYDANDIGLANDAAVDAANTIQSWFEEELIPVGIDAEILNGLFRQGKVGMVVSGPWSIPDYSEDLGDSLAVTPLPTWNGEPLNSFSGNKGWLVNYYTDHLYWATELALFITNAESSKTYFEIAGEIPAHSGVEINDEFMGAFFQQAQVAEPMPNIPEMSKVWQPIAEALEFISRGEDPAEVLEEAVEQIQSEIAIMGQ
ncbi:arabinogalactan oligomer / maltooligosaccharide transport system substrate-binding protein [Evansella caseinilytica]|uniref:Maltodextrin-binding protein n=1 Tax=Evansella caseinilytica TaxID=1503961 RepID=A0A1H3ITT5_9BACI|nr:extracellular solute-binding protein [Evansella caseinilytica]SDY31110.1 arabinogalactan oligomer / maltooligosaccharide transport system substrate-binding protein [Evansella caseinilytica]